MRPKRPHPTLTQAEMSLPGAGTADAIREAATMLKVSVQAVVRAMRITREAPHLVAEIWRGATLGEVERQILQQKYRSARRRGK